MSEHSLLRIPSLERDSSQEGTRKTQGAAGSRQEHATATLRSGERAASQPATLPHHGILICKYSSHGSDGDGDGGGGGGLAAAVRGALAG